MLAKMSIALAVAMVGSFVFRVQLVEIVQAPLRKVDPELVESLQVLGVADSMMISLRLAFFAGIIISFPFLLYFLLEFVLPGLTRRERKYLFPSIWVGGGLFLSGVLFCYFLVLPAALTFFFNDARSLDWRPAWTVTGYFSFVTQFLLSFGMCFEVPVVVMFLVRIGILNHAILQRTRAYAVVVILFLAAVITPTQDVFTLLALGAPMIVLYEACIWISLWLERRERRTAEAAQP